MIEDMAFWTVIFLAWLWIFSTVKYCFRTYNDIQGNLYISVMHSSLCPKVVTGDS